MDSSDRAFRTLDTEWITLADGRRLAARLWLPEGAGPVPAILEYLPYRRRDGTAPRDATTYPVFAAAGYAGVRVDMAGTGDSDGLLDGEYLKDELAVGAELVAWIAAQPWCTGAVGIIGISWGGFNGLQIAMRRPPALKAVVSVCSTTDRYADDIHYEGGCLLNDNMTWAQQMLAYQSRPPDPAVVGTRWRQLWTERLEAMPFLAAEWLEHQRRDAFWQHGSVCDDWSAIQVPVLSIGGWADAYRNTAVALLEGLHAPVKALMGPWDHKYPHLSRVKPTNDFHGEVIGWFDRWLKGEPNGADALPAYRVFEAEYQPPSPHFGVQAGRWIAEAEWPSPAVSARTLRLSERGLGEKTGNGERTVRSPQTLGAAGGNFCPGMRNENELPLDQREDDAASVCFDTGPLAEDLHLLGQPWLELEVSADRPCAFLVGRLCEVAPDGTSSLISYRPFNLTHRASHEHPEPLVPGQRVMVRFPLNQCARRIRAGHTLRLALSNAYWPIVWPSPEPVAVTLHLSGCSLTLPVRRPGQDGPVSEPGPARDFPRERTETLEAPECTGSRGTDAEGRLVLDTYDGFGRTLSRETGLKTFSSVRQRFVVHPDDPASAQAKAAWVQEVGRGDWRTRTETVHRMTATATEFHVEAELRAYGGDRLVHEARWHRSVPRDLV